MDNCFLCYHKHSPALWDLMATVGTVGQISNVIIAASYRRAIEWFRDSVADGLDAGFHISKYSLDSFVVPPDKISGDCDKLRKFGVLMCSDRDDGVDDDDNDEWYEIVIEVKELET